MNENKKEVAQEESVQGQQVKVLCPKCNGTFVISKVCPQCSHCYDEECNYCGHCGTKLINLHL